MAEEHFVIIGNGPAGREAAVTLREKIPDTRITLMSKENVGSYQPRLLPDFMTGRIKEHDLFVCPLKFYKDLGIKLRLGQEVVNVNFDRREITLDHKEIIPFTGLIVAVGGQPRIPEPLHPYRDFLWTLKTLAHARAWIQRLAEVDSILILGGDLTSLAVTKALLHLGKKVTFMLTEEAFWPIRCNEELFADITRKLKDKGIHVIEGRCLKSVIQLPEKCCEVVVDSECFKVDIVGAFYGLVPDVGFLKGSGLHIERGILVDEYLNTGFRRVYAAGDCAQVYHPQLKDYWVSIGYDNALNLGRIAASNLAGGMIEAEVAPESIFCDEGVRVNTSWWTEF